MSEDRHSNGRLDSWKEIAAYLNRDVRTVIRWEDKGLPVHRVPGGKRQAVFAYPGEIDAWLSGEQQQATLQVDAPGDSQVAEAGASPVMQQGPVRSSDRESKPGRVPIFAKITLKAGIASVLILTLAWITGAMFVPSHTSATVHPLSVRELTDDGRAKGALRTDGKALYFTEAEGTRSILASVPVTGGTIRHFKLPFSNVALQDVSKDGSTLLISSYEGILPEGPLWEFPLRGEAPQRVGDAACNLARWSPDNSKIACVDGTRIVMMASDGSHQRTVASLAMPITQLYWTPDGRRLRYVLSEQPAHVYSQWDILLGPDDTALRTQEILLGSSCCLDWTTTRDGKTVFLTELDKLGKTHLMVQTEKVQQPTELPLHIGSVWPVVAGRTDNTLYLGIAGVTRSQLLKFDASRGVFESMLPGLSASYVSFSQDGQWITYTDPGGGALWRSRTDGSEAVQLANSSMEVEVSSWSPDGQTIAFMGRMPGKPFRIYLTGRDGGKIREASEGEDNQGGPSWSPDGKAIVYGNVYCEETRSCWIRRLDVATRKTEILPGSAGLRTARWSADGKYVAALRFRTHELMLFDTGKRRWRVLADSVTGDNINWSHDSQYVYVDSPKDAKPEVERIGIQGDRRTTVVRLDSLQNVPGIIDSWVGLTPDNSPIVSNMITSNEIYALNWN